MLSSCSCLLLRHIWDLILMAAERPESYFRAFFFSQVQLWWSSTSSSWLSTTSLHLQPAVERWMGIFCTNCRCFFGRFLSRQIMHKCRWGKSQMEPLIFLIYFISFIVIILETKLKIVSSGWYFCD